MAISMEFILRINLSAIFFLLFFLLAFFHMRTRADDHLPPEKDDIQSVISALRGSGYHFFADSLKMVDIQSLLSSQDSYTFFAPPDEALYDLMFTCKSSQEYTDAIKHHIVKVKLSYYNLSRLPEGAHLDTLMPKRSLIVTKVALDEDEDDAVMVDNAAISFPDLYYNNRFTVHGVATILNPAAVDVLSVLASREVLNAMATPSCEREFVGNSLLESKPLNVCVIAIQNVSVIPLEKNIEDSSYAKVLPSPAPSPCNEVDEAISSKKVDEPFICGTSSSSQGSVSVSERCSSAEYCGDHKYDSGDHPQDHDRYHHCKHPHSHMRHSDSSPSPSPSPPPPPVKTLTLSLSVSLSFSPPSG